jgi:hypothetical protein
MCKTTLAILKEVSKTALNASVHCALASPLHSRGGGEGVILLSLQYHSSFYCRTVILPLIDHFLTMEKESEQFCPTQFGNVTPYIQAEDL